MNNISSIVKTSNIEGNSYGMISSSRVHAFCVPIHLGVSRRVSRTILYSAVMLGLCQAAPLDDFRLKVLEDIYEKSKNVL